ncbi:MAG: hypothetical protein LBF22_13305 [Deltaproteobacteria bacterium]|nr:hypothetical protein [Deltaproteobacteria bacterium]
MTSINSNNFLPAQVQKSRTTWREEMLDQILKNMRKHPNPTTPPVGETLKTVPNNESLIEKGLYINIYV